jgi:hypothetical protein
MIKLTKDEVAEIVSKDGIGMAVLDTISHTDIEDPVLGRIWAEAEAALYKIEYLLYRRRK